MYSVVKTQWRGYVELLSSLVHNRIGCCPSWYADATIHLVELLLFHLFLLFFLFHNYNTIIMLTRCVRWSRPVLLWNIVCSSVNVVHQLLVELHFLFFFLFHNDMSFKLFIISVENYGIKLKMPRQNGKNVGQNGKTGQWPVRVPRGAHLYKGLATLPYKCSRNCQWDERRSLGVGVQALASNPLQAAAVGNVAVVSVAERYVSLSWTQVNHSMRCR